MRLVGVAAPLLILWACSGPATLVKSSGDISNLAESDIDRDDATRDTAEVASGAREGVSREREGCGGRDSLMERGWEGSELEERGD